MDALPKSKTFAGKIDSLPSIMGWVESCLIHTNAPITKIQLAIEEAVVNVMRHSYKGKEGEITLSCLLKDNLVEFEVRDHGAPFNPLSGEYIIDTKADLSAREEGGLGIILMKKFMSSLDYRREGDENVLILRRDLS